MRGAIDALGAAEGREKWKWDIKDNEGIVVAEFYVSTGLIRIACHSGRHRAVIVAKEVARFMKKYNIN
eukprot:3206702-Karenia_brevis.AAC.1